MWGKHVGRADNLFDLAAFQSSGGKDTHIFKDEKRAIHSRERGSGSVVETEPNVDRIIELSFAGGDGMSGTLRYTYQVWAEDASYEFRRNLV